MLQKLQTVVEFSGPVPPAQWTETLDEGGKGRHSLFRGDGGQQRGVVGVDIVRTFLEVQPVERTRRGRREATKTQSLGDSPWKGKHCHESTDLVD